MSFRFCESFNGRIRPHPIRGERLHTWILAVDDDVDFAFSVDRQAQRVCEILNRWAYSLSGHDAERYYGVSPTGRGKELGNGFGQEDIRRRADEPSRDACGIA